MISYNVMCTLSFSRVKLLSTILLEFKFFVNEIATQKHANAKKNKKSRVKLTESTTKTHKFLFDLLEFKESKKKKKINKIQRYK